MVLAGGDGLRMRPLTRRLMGDERPKQFCPLFGHETLLEETGRRVALAIPRDQTLTIVTRTHERFYRPLLAGAQPWSVVVQPRNRGTAPALLYALLRLAARTPMAPVAVFPSDHFVSDDEAFMRHVETAFEAVRARPDLVILLGIAADSAEVEYGWIEPGEPVLAAGGSVISRVRRFWEKPSEDLAGVLQRRGCLWNSFVMVAQLTAFLALIRSARPDLWEAFAGIRDELDTLGEDEAVRALYARLPEANFSREVLARRPANLAVLPVRGVEWSDLGEPRRVLARLAGAGSRWVEPAGQTA
jgi:mannose-1-phosphate guanylyltransferase